MFTQLELSERKRERERERDSAPAFLRPDITAGTVECAAYIKLPSKPALSLPPKST